MPTNLLEILLNSALQNEKLGNVQKAVILTKTSLNAIGLGNTDHGLKLAHKALEANPNEPQYWLIIIQMSADVHKYSKARLLLSRFESKKISKLASLKIKRLKSLSTSIKNDIDRSYKLIFF